MDGAGNVQNSSGGQAGGGAVDGTGNGQNSGGGQPPGTVINNYAAPRAGGEHGGGDPNKRGTNQDFSKEKQDAVDANVDANNQGFRQIMDWKEARDKYGYENLGTPTTSEGLKDSLDAVSEFANERLRNPNNGAGGTQVNTPRPVAF